MTASKSQYPYSQPPELGVLREIATGVYWLRMPLPFKLDHINLWVLEEDDGWTIVDTGLATDATTDLWESLYKKMSSEKPIKRIIGTHMHPDHIGLAAWLCRRSGAELWMSRSEYMYCRILLEDSNREAPDEAVAFYHAAGLNEEQLNYYRSKFGAFSNLIRGVPAIYHRLKDNDTLTVNNHQWQIVMGEGHSPEHACLFCPDLELFVSGDQLLPTISSNVSVWPIEPLGNPLKDWISSCHKLKSIIPENTLVLPSHGLPFKGAAQRLQKLTDDHERDLQIIHKNADTPKRVVDFFPLIFKSKITHSTIVLATGESYAHLHCLIDRGMLSVDQDKYGVNWYQRI
ncbi:MAG: glyoxylase-like metal-dependent hydrolase (beta-lactamase superfamily II) [Porticoccus sp.]|jgi:glyoxylase-like metal-dependent hydrolase (beta-lactamase superfamily II)